MSGYSSTPLSQKLGLQSGLSCRVIAAPKKYDELLTPLPADLNWNAAPPLAFIHAFVTSRADLERDFPEWKSLLAKDGMLWTSWPKKTAKPPHRIETDLDENIIREIGLSCGLVDVKVCAVDETWSGLKFVYRKRDR